MTEQTETPDQPLQLGDEVEYDGHRYKVASVPGFQYPGRIPTGTDHRVLVQREESTTRYRSPLVSEVRRVAPPVAGETSNPADEAAVNRAAVSAASDAMTALLKPFAHQCNLFVTGQVGIISPTTTEVATAALTAALPYLTGPLVEEVARLRARDAAWQAYAELLADRLWEISILVSKPAMKCSGLESHTVQEIDELAHAAGKPAVLAETPAPTTQEKQA